MSCRRALFPVLEVFRIGLLRLVWTLKECWIRFGGWLVLCCRNGVRSRNRIVWRFLGSFGTFCGSLCRGRVFFGVFFVVFFVGNCLVLTRNRCFRYYFYYYCWVKKNKGGFLVYRERFLSKSNSLWRIHRILVRGKYRTGSVGLWWWSIGKVHFAITVKIN